MMACKSRCRDGWVVLSRQQAGYERVEVLDTPGWEGWVSPGGQRCWFREGEAVEVRRMCECKRQAWRVRNPSRGGARHPAGQRLM
jgi:hypothetical protein